MTDKLNNIIDLISWNGTVRLANPVPLSFTRNTIQTLCGIVESTCRAAFELGQNTAKDHHDYVICFLLVCERRICFTVSPDVKKLNNRIMRRTSDRETLITNAMYRAPSYFLSCSAIAVWYRVHCYHCNQPQSCHRIQSIQTDLSSRVTSQIHRHLERIA